MSKELDQLKNDLKTHEVQLFDVREEEEWEDGHLVDAYLVPLSKLDDGIEPNNVNLSMKTYLHCKSGRRVHAAKPLLEQMGFVNVIALSEGFDELANYGFEAE